jgi:hypothetical protein
MANHGYFAGQIFAPTGMAADILVHREPFQHPIKKARRSAGPFQILICSN